MNNRGKKLPHLELLKDRLIYLSTKLDAEASERERLRHVINEGWKSVYHYLGKNKLKPLDDLFLFNHFVLYFGDVLIDEEDVAYSKLRRFYGQMDTDNHYSRYLLENKFTARNLSGDGDANKPLTIHEIYHYVASLKQSVELWYQSLNPDDSLFTVETKAWLEKLNRIGISAVAPLILVFFQTESNPAIRMKFLKALENILFLNLLDLDYPFMYVHTNWNFVEMAAKTRRGDVSAAKAIQDIEADAEALRKRPDFISAVGKGLRTRGFYSWRGIRYFLYEYEIHLQAKSKTHKTKINWPEYVQRSEDFASVEHIYPQNARRQCWMQTFNRFGTRERNILKHSIGNLVPLSRAKNSSLQNKCFDEK